MSGAIAAASPRNSRRPGPAPASASASRHAAPIAPTHATIPPTCTAHVGPLSALAGSGSSAGPARARGGPRMTGPIAIPAAVPRPAAPPGRRLRPPASRSSRGAALAAAQAGQAAGPGPRGSLRVVQAGCTMRGCTAPANRIADRDGIDFCLGPNQIRVST